MTSNVISGWLRPEWINNWPNFLTDRRLCLWLRTRFWSVIKTNIAKLNIILGAWIYRHTHAHVTPLPMKATDQPTASGTPPEKEHTPYPWGMRPIIIIIIIIQEVVNKWTADARITSRDWEVCSSWRGILVIRDCDTVVLTWRDWTNVSHNETHSMTHFAHSVYLALLITSEQKLFLKSQHLAHIRLCSFIISFSTSSFLISVNWWYSDIYTMKQEKDKSN
jgi:hypothetical protein